METARWKEDLGETWGGRCTDSTLSGCGQVPFKSRVIGVAEEYVGGDWRVPDAGVVPECSPLREVQPQVRVRVQVQVQVHV